MNLRTIGIGLAVVLVVLALLWVLAMPARAQANGAAPLVLAPSEPTGGA